MFWEILNGNLVLRIFLVSVFIFFTVHYCMDGRWTFHYRWAISSKKISSSCFFHFLALLQCFRPPESTCNELVLLVVAVSITSALHNKSYATNKIDWSGVDVWVSRNAGPILLSFEKPKWWCWLLQNLYNISNYYNLHNVASCCILSTPFHRAPPTVYIYMR